MKNEIGVVLGFIATILGAFILFNAGVSLFGGKSKDCQYNIGCYEVAHSINRSQHILTRITNAKDKESISKIGTSLQSLPQEVPNNFQNNTIQLALSFEKFINKLTQQHDYNFENIQIYREVAKAEKQYQICKAVIDKSFSEQDCNQNWEEYLSCSKKMDDVRLKLEFLQKDEEIVRQEVNRIIQKPDSSISNLELAKRIYNDSMNVNQKKRQELVNKISSLQKNLSSQIFERDETLEKYQLKFRNYRECQQNKKRHDACQKISEEVRNINAENLKNLQIMVLSKAELVRSLQRIIEQQKNSKQIQELNQKYLKHREEYIVMHKELISLIGKNQKACGCTPELEADLRIQLDQLNTKASSLSTNVRNLNVQISDLNKQLKQCDEERDRIVKKYKDAVEKNERGPSQGKSELSQVSRSLQNKYGEVLDLQGIYANINAECEEIKVRMGKRVQEISAINDCLAKKNYFLELKRQTRQYIHSDYDELNNILKSKEEIAYFLKAIAPQ